MSVKEKEMAELLAKTHRNERLSAVVACVSPSASTILDLGCGIGALTSRLAEKFPSTMIVGIDRSKYLLKKAQREKNFTAILGDVPALPFKNCSFDLAVAVQVLHEIFHFKGVEALTRTFQNIFHLLKSSGELVILDHFNPGDAPISFRLSEELRKKLDEFQSKFKPRRIVYYDLGDGWIRSHMRDFCDFVTKIWALNTGLEEEEMNETHTPLTCQEFETLLQEAGFRVTHATHITSLERHLQHYDITVEAAGRLPKRHILLRARKTACTR